MTYGPKPKPVAERFWPKIDFSADCWEWLAGLDSYGYGRFRTPRKTENAHRVAYELLVGPIPDGLQLDHLCRNRACVNPDHLDPVTGRKNVLRGAGHAAKNAAKTHCSAGHEFTEANTYVDTRRYRVCRTCHNDANRRRRRAAVAS